MPGVLVDETGNIHLLENYGSAATRTLCGIPVPKMWGAVRGDVHWGHPGHETCAECRTVHDARVARLGGSPPPPTRRAQPVSRTVRRIPPR